MPKRTLISEPREVGTTRVPAPQVHDAKKFRLGDKVRIASKPATPQVEGWSNAWSAGQMDRTIGMKGVVMKSTLSGVEVMIDGQPNPWYYPSCSLEMDRPKKRVRVGPGPWDAAPCTHLRWQLMGFFREKLVLVKSEGGPAEVKVRCTKCKCEMTLRTQ